MGTTPVILNLLKTRRVLYRLLKQRILAIRGCKASAVPRRGLGLLVLVVTRRCNMRCKMCIQSHDIHRDKEPEDRLTLDDYAVLLEQARPLDPVVQVTGGELFLYRDIEALLTLIKDKGLFCMLNTNGSLLKNHAPLIVKLGIEKITVSIDGPPEIHDAIRNFPRAHELALEGIKTLHEEKLRQGSPYPFIDVKGVITPDNVGRLEPVVQLAATGMVQMVDLVHMWFLHTSQTAKHTAEGHSVPFYAPHAFELFRQEDLGPALEHVRDLQRRYRRHPFIVFPDFSEETLRTYYARPDVPLHQRPCVYPYEAARIMPNGDVMACPEDIAAKAPIGNIRRETLTEVIRGRAAARLLAKLDEAGGAWPVCYRCCGIFRS